MKIDRARVVADLIGLASEISAEWDYDGVISDATRPFEDLGWQSIDFVTLAEGIQTLYARTFPFNGFFSNTFRREEGTASIGELADFLVTNLAPDSG
jgi:acyl carrier protein